jgi:cystathionine gamma-synthase
MTKLTLDTRAVRAGLESCDVTGAVVPPLHLSSTYAFRGFGDKAAVDVALSKPAALVWIETPSNPLLRITDLADISRRAHAIGALVIADNTFLSPGWQRPLEHGADLVVHSTTKYINGHSDVVGGAVISKTKELAEQVGWWANCLGLTAGAFDSYLTLRGLRTLHVRLREHGRNAQAIAEFLAKQGAVKKVYFPGLPAHPGHEIAKRQQSGFGAIVTLEVAGGVEGAKKFSESLELFSLAESLGGVESLIAHPATMTHAAMAPEARAAAGLVDGLLRLSIGIESTEDLLADLRRGIDALG